VKAFGLALLLLATPACTRAADVAPKSERVTSRPSVDAARPEEAPLAPPPRAPARARPAPAERTGVDGPHELLLEPSRPIYYALPREREGVVSLAGGKPWRLLGHLHGVCGPPSYACGKWVGAAADVGVLVCPTGNARCGDSPVGPPSWEAPTWQELVTQMDRDLEASIAKVEAKHRGSLRRDGAVLTGYSRGAYAAPVIARAHPGRWPYLVLIEANVPLTAEGLQKAGVRAVALVAGEQGAEIAGERRTQAELEKAGFPARLVVMPRTGHLYSDDMERVMSEALAFVLSN
jgi:predicted esterase